MIKITGEAWHTWGLGICGKISVPLSQFCCEPITALKKQQQKEKHHTTTLCMIVLVLYSAPQIKMGTLNQGSPIPGLQTTTSPWPDSNWPAQQEVSSGGLREASSVSEASLQHLHHYLSPSSDHQSDSYRSTSPQCQKGWRPLL